MTGAPNVFLVASSAADAVKNFQRTVLEGVPASTFEEYTSIPAEGDKLPIWGTKSGNKGAWKQVEKGDFLLFYQDRHFAYAAEVLETEENEALGRELWPDHEEGDPWKFILYLSNVTETDISRDEINQHAGYKSNFAPQGFQSLRDSGVESIAETYGSVANFVTGKPKNESLPKEIDIHSKPTVSLPSSIFEGLYFPDQMETEIIQQINSALNADKHIIFTGPPGTGKTEIARQVAKHLSKEYPEFYSGYQLTTATADWTTFETVGGYMPGEKGEGEDLTFEPGQVLRRLKRRNTQLNELLIIDEINRADIDKSFGQLFTLLSGQAVQLPYKREGEEIEIHPAKGFEGTPADHQYVMPESWRILATMNSYDKTSLYEMSYAFMRRFAFIHIGAPLVPETDEEMVSLLENYANEWGFNPSQEVLAGIGQVWQATNRGDQEREIGPAIVKDMMGHVIQSSDGSLNDVMSQSIANYVFPQLEGVPDRRKIVSRLAKTDYVNGDWLWRLAGDVLRVTPNE